MLGCILFNEDGSVWIPADMDPGFIYTEGAVARAHDP